MTECRWDPDANCCRNLGLLWSGAIELDGALAQLGEHLLCKQGVIGSIPISSTKSIGVEISAIVF